MEIQTKYSFFSCVPGQLIFFQLSFNYSLPLSHHASRFHSSPHPFISALCPCDLSPDKIKFKRERVKGKSVCSWEAVVRHSESHSTDLYASIYKCSLHNLGFLLQYRCWALTGISLASTILLLPCVVVILQFWVCWTGPFM